MPYSSDFRFAFMLLNYACRPCGRGPNAPRGGRQQAGTPDWGMPLVSSTESLMKEPVSSRYQ